MSSERSTPDGVQQLVDQVRSSLLPTPGERRRIRLRAHVSLRAAAAALGVSAAAVQSWEKGRQPRPATATAYRAFLDALTEATDDAA